MTELTIIVLKIHQALAQRLCEAMAGSAGAGMFCTPLTGNGASVTHYVSSGWISSAFAHLLCSGGVQQEEGKPAYYIPEVEWVLSTLARAEIEHDPGEVREMLESITVSDSDPFQIFGDLGLSLYFEPITI